MAITTKLDDGTIKKEFVGAVLCDREENYHDDSDGYCIVWDETEGKLRKIYTWTTRCGSNTNGYADATEDVKEKAAAWLEKWLEPQVRAHLTAKAEAVVKGARVVVERGRKVPHGTEGVVMWEGDATFGFHHVTHRIGIRTDAGDVVFTARENVRRLDVLPIDETEVARLCKNGRYAFHYPFVNPGMLVA